MMGTMRTFDITAEYDSYFDLHPIFAQRGLPADNPGDGGVVQAPVLDVANVVDGQVMDLSRDLVGRMLYCTSQGDVGRIVPGGSKKNRAKHRKKFIFTTKRALSSNINGTKA